jgi:hypothetical protein
MSASTTNTWDIATARRPSLDDVGGAVLIDDSDNPPDPNTMPYAAQLNQLQYQAQALAKVAAVAILDVVNSGTASLSRFTAPGTNVITGSFTLNRTSAGIVDITWAAGALPVAAANAVAQMTTDAAWCAPVTVAITNGVRVKTRNQAGTLTDGNFTVVVY